jgi:hypothetical protein
MAITYVENEFGNIALANGLHVRRIAPNKDHP